MGKKGTIPPSRPPHLFFSAVSLLFFCFGFTHNPSIQTPLVVLVSLACAHGGWLLQFDRRVGRASALGNVSGWVCVAEGWERAVWCKRRRQCTRSQPSRGVVPYTNIPLHDAAPQTTVWRGMCWADAQARSRFRCRRRHRHHHHHRRRRRRRRCSSQTAFVASLRAWRPRRDACARPVKGRWRGHRALGWRCCHLPGTSQAF